MTLHQIITGCTLITFMLLFVVIFMDKIQVYYPRYTPQLPELSVS